MAQAPRHDRSIGALGARWGMQSEAAFRNALAGILEKSFGVEAVNVNEYDDRGEVFGRPDQVDGRNHQKRPAADFRAEVVHRQDQHVHFRAQGALLRKAPPAQGRLADRDFADDRHPHPAGRRATGDRNLHRHRWMCRRSNAPHSNPSFFSR